MRSAKRIEEIEVLRCLAVCMVFIYHAQNLFYAPGTFARFFRSYVNFSSGVDLFFVISGFVITLDLMRSFDSTTLRAQKYRLAFAFWIRRAFRIWPSTWLWLGLFLIVATCFNQFRAAGDPAHNINDAISAIGQFANFHWYECYSGKIQCGNNSIFWSLSLEEQFYLGLPLLFIFFRKRLPGVIFAAVLLQLFVPRPEWSLAWVFRTDALCLGVLLAFFYGSSRYLDLKDSGLLRFASSWIGKIALFLIIGTAGWHFFGLRTGLLACTCAVLVLLASYDSNLLIPNCRIKSTMIWIGGRSFAVYLVHYPVMCVVLEFANRYLPHDTVWSGALNWPMVLFTASATLLIADLNYRFVEIPGRRMGSRLSNYVQSRSTLSVNSQGSSGTGIIP